MSGFIKDTFKTSILGGGVSGAQPRGGLIGDTTIGNERNIDRSILRRGFGNMFNSGLGTSPLYMSNNGGTKCGPFRCALSAGDVNGRVNSSSNKKYGIEHNNTSQVRRSIFNLSNIGIKQDDGNAAYAGNPKHVFDTSDYVRFMRLSTNNKTYNDLSLGGDNHHAEQSALSRMKM